MQMEKRKSLFFSLIAIISILVVVSFVLPLIDNSNLTNSIVVVLRLLCFLIIVIFIAYDRVLMRSEGAR